MVKVRILPEIGQKSEIPFSNKVFFFSRIVSVFLPGSQDGIKSLQQRNAIMCYLKLIRNNTTLKQSKFLSGKMVGMFISFHPPNLVNLLPWLLAVTPRLIFKIKKEISNITPAYQIYMNQLIFNSDNYVSHCGLMS